MKQNEIHTNHKVHRNVIYGIVFILIVMQLISFISINAQVSRIDSKITSMKEDFEISILESEEKYNELLEKYNTENQRNFNEISQLIFNQEKSLKQEINLLKTGQGDFSSVINDAINGVVSVGTDKSAGTGFLVSNDGYIITNEHVIANANKIAVLTSERDVIPASLIGYDKVRDIALLKIQGDYDYLELKDSNDVRVGNKVIAIGNPLGLSFTVTEGIVSAVDRQGPNGLNEYIQTDVSLNPGNSGGPLIDTTGKVIGVNNFKLGDAESIGFALESNSVKTIANIIANRTIIQ